MTVISHALGFKRFRQESLELSLLRSDNFPVVLAVVAQHFPQGAIAKPASDLYQLLSEDFRVLRDEGFELPKSPPDYINDWVKSRWFVRRPGSSQTGETVEPSEELLAVLDSVQRWDNPHRSISASRIESLTQALQTLALESDPSMAKRLAELERERERIERQIEAVNAGEFEVITTTQISERVADILDLAASIPADFARVRHELSDLNRKLRRQLLDPEDARGDVLEEIFKGVDLIGDSDAGRSFNSFFDVLLDRERSSLIDRWIRDVLGRDEAIDLDPALRTRLYRIFRDMEDASFEVNGEMTGLARSLRHYVTTEEFAESRRMIQLLRDTRNAAAKAAEAGEITSLNHMDTPLVRIGMDVRSIAGLKLKNPGEERVEELPEPVESQEIDTETLMAQIRASEIDFEELEDAVAVILEKQSHATIAEVLVQSPATQGLASIVGLLYMAMREGVPTGQPQNVEWEHEGTTHRRRISGWQFIRGLGGSGGFDGIAEGED
ncbi:DUF3375 domain-containing protein [Corynebacterium suranareeae]|nr:DUF3375 domain-containing protein [Corynebacterium suranareeae]